MSKAMRRLSSLNNVWTIAKDQNNIGKRERWFQLGPVEEARDTKIPSVLEETFHDYDGIVWYWHTFSVPGDISTDSRVLLRFGAADYFTELRVNGEFVGQHEGGNAPFTFDITPNAKPGEDNVLVVRVINPGIDPIDGYDFRHIPHSHRLPNWRASDNRYHNFGGIWQDVELEIVPPVRVSDIFAEPSIPSSTVTAHINFFNSTGKTEEVKVRASVSPATGGSPVAVCEEAIAINPGQSCLDTTIQLPNLELWWPDRPYLYLLTISLLSDGEIRDEALIRFGFREITYQDGFFYLNGKRFFIKSAHILGNYPGGLAYPTDKNMLRRELLQMKRIGLNTIRSLGRCMIPPQLDICDEIGLMVYEETPASWLWEDSVQMKRRFDAEVRGMILRDRNHPSVIIWGLLNEMRDGPIFRYAVTTLPMLRKLDPTRLVALNSGGFHGEYGAFSLPYTETWDTNIMDTHIYKTWPLSEEDMHLYRHTGESQKKVWLSEFGFGSAIDPIRCLREFEQMGVPSDNDDVRLYRRLSEQFEADFQRLGLDAIWPTTSDFARCSEERQAENMRLALDLAYANPNLVGCSFTSFCDETMNGRGAFSIFRDAKYPVANMLEDVQKPLRWSLFVNPTSIYYDEKVNIEAILRNEDALPAGKYSARLMVTGPKGIIWEKQSIVEIPVSGRGIDKIVFPIFQEEIKIEGPEGKYEALVYLEQGGMARSLVPFYVSDPNSLTKVTMEVVGWGVDEQQIGWLAAHGVRVRQFDPSSESGKREIFLIGSPKIAPNHIDEYNNLLARIGRGSIALFLSPSIFAGEETGGRSFKLFPDPAAGPVWPISARASWNSIDHFIKPHPIFEGLPQKTLLDKRFYRSVYPRISLGGLKLSEVLAGAFSIGSVGGDTGYWYAADIAILPISSGKIIVSTYLILENLGCDPAADKLMINILGFVNENLLP